MSYVLCTMNYVQLNMVLKPSNVKSENLSGPIFILVTFIIIVVGSKLGKNAKEKAVLVFFGN